MNKNFLPGLKPTPKDDRDFSFGAKFGYIQEVPKENFVVAEPLEIKDQGRSKACTGAAVMGVLEDHEGMILGFKWFYAQTMKSLGFYTDQGSDLRTPCQIAVSIGAIEKKDEDSILDNVDSDFWANSKNYSENLNEKARFHRQLTYFLVDNLGNTFDAYLGAMWRNLEKKSSIFTGVMWQSHWTSAEGGIIKGKELSQNLGGHAIKVFGQKIIDGEPYLMVQNSYGTDVGDNGIFYFDREAINRHFIFGGYMFYDIDPEVIKKEQWNYIQRQINSIKRLIAEITLKVKQLLANR